MKKYKILIFLFLIFTTTSLFAKGVSIKAYFTRAFKDVAYQRKMVNRVIKNFKYLGKLPPVGKKCVYIVRVKRDGSLLVNSRWRSSGSKKFDEACKKSIIRSTPFPKLPETFFARYLEVHFHFEVIK